MLKGKIETIQKITKKCLNLALALTIFFSFLNVLRAQEAKENKSNLPEFESIHVSGVAKVFFTQEEAKEITMIVSGDPYPQVIREVKKGVLEIYTKGEAQNEVVEVFVSNPILTSITVSDRAEFHSIENMEMKALKIEVKDVGSAEMDINVEKVLIHMDGGDLTISGKAKEQHIKKSKYSKRGTLDNSHLEIVQ